MKPALAALLLAVCLATTAYAEIDVRDSDVVMYPNDVSSHTCQRTWP